MEHGYLPGSRQGDPGAENVTLSGKYLCKVYEGPYGDTGKWCRDFELYAREQNLTYKEMVHVVYDLPQMCQKIWEKLCCHHQPGNMSRTFVVRQKGSRMHVVCMTGITYSSRPSLHVNGEWLPWGEILSGLQRSRSDRQARCGAGQASWNRIPLYV